ncbi:Outer membrane protein W precursor [Pseudovibrio sp. W64]|uniref:OmpW/AlkL family protein n=1 Tax=unclassified Pseudovibrio TaxID=2627060 RepID=UPI00070B4B07|nr:MULTISPECIES: OmpW family protein [unclassified Pseudovibrio]KZK79350.1 Outer membrane protein W precursor [Pseudovibrio sp. W64]KZK81249.1 Outer membrane protein W precursor [Pseudovibrio sp. Ad13]KZL22985.1 Outer membrane protein W precursor [Pseudovibrio sp. WM33]
MSLKRVMGLMVTAAMVVPAGQVLAADMPVPQEDIIAAAASEKSPWQIRVRALGVITEDSGHVNGVSGSDLSYSNTVVPELDITYYFTENIAAELILGTTWANVDGDGALAGTDVGDTWILPPTLTLQYHFTNFGAFKPYIGAGVNYTIFYNQDANDVDDLDIENTFGAALQVGFDYMIDDNWGVNLDVKKLFLEPDFDVKVGSNKLKGTAELNPWLVGAGITYRF